MKNHEPDKTSSYLAFFHEKFRKYIFDLIMESSANSKLDGLAFI